MFDWYYAIWYHPEMYDSPLGHWAAMAFGYGVVPLVLLNFLGIVTHSVYRHTKNKKEKTP